MCMLAEPFEFFDTFSSPKNWHEHEDLKKCIDKLINHGFASFVCNVIYLISSEGLLHKKKKSLALT